MYVHTMTLTTYDPKRGKRGARTAQGRRHNRRALECPQVLSPLSLLSMPRMPPVLFTEDVLPRPAVIGVGASYGSYEETAAAIKDILCSVLNLPRSINSTASVNADPQDSDEEILDTNISDNNMDANGDPDGIPILTTAHDDIRFHRHTAAWDNTQLDSNNMSRLDTLAPITSTYSVPELDLSPYIQCEKCSDFILPESEFFTKQNLPINSQKEKRRFSSPSVAPHHANPPQCSSMLDDFAFHLNETETDTETSFIDDPSIHRRSLSCSNLVKVTGSPPASSTEALQLSVENQFEPTVNLEKENEHFLAADLFISVVEMMKSSWQSDQFQTEGGMYWLRKDPEELCYRRHKANSESATSVDSGYDGLVAVQSSPVETILEEEEHDDSTTCDDDYYSDYEIIEMEDFEKLMASNNASNDSTAGAGPPVSNTAEQTARNLYRAFRQQWTLIEVDGQLPAKLNTVSRFYANMIPEEFESSVCLAEEIKRSKMVNDEDWSPPRFQVITTVHQFIRRDVVVASQNYFCAGCGTKVEPRYTSRLRYCDYLGKYFCDCCHHYSESSIPGRILSKWNFSKYYVSNFSKSVVDKIWDSHIFNVQNENPALYKKVKDLNRVQEVQQQLIHIRKLVMTCRFADSIIKAFEEVPSHLTRELHLFTLADLYNVKQKALLPGLRELLALAIAHVDKCELCEAKGFFCEFCRNSDVIFPFQTDICKRCEDCKTCYHKECFKTNDCPKCIRIKAREALNNELSFTSSEEVDPTSTS